MVLSNRDITLWFAEIDHLTGKVLWRKNIRNYLKAKIKNSKHITAQNHHDIYIKKALLLEDNTIVWAGDGSYAPNSFRNIGVLLKTDLEGNPIWYREYDMHPDSDDPNNKGMKVFNIVQTDDGGFILAGEYEDRNNPAWHHSALLKVDEYGCYEKRLPAKRVHR